eukprot:NODE_7525_length_587_cov_66.802174_g7502_i0.p1 GENE.NODE_7525_length_587_cov_66.802174_g7502_i0~~NODE_7525_length_587_cov_66.802174_g7502_i0.p1  ORF type:complete len:161 (-),score=13.92 NODE_7525_length_587_cov_66.802174_g7502_i0:21-503(-)
MYSNRVSNTDYMNVQRMRHIPHLSEHCTGGASGLGPYGGYSGWSVLPDAMFDSKYGHVPTPNTYRGDTAQRHRTPARRRERRGGRTHHNSDDCCGCCQSLDAIPYGNFSYTALFGPIAAQQYIATTGEDCGCCCNCCECARGSSRGSGHALGSGQFMLAC